MTGIPGKSAAFQRDLNWLEKWADNSFMEFNKGECGVLHLRRNNHIHQYMLETNQLENSCAEKDLEVLVYHRLNMNQKCAFVAGAAETILACFLYIW